MNSKEPLDKNMLLFGFIVGLILIYTLNHYNKTKNIPKPTKQTTTNLVLATNVIDITDHNVFNRLGNYDTFRGPDPRYIHKYKNRRVINRNRRHRD